MRGKKHFERFKKGERLTHKEAILAQCYACNGLDEGGVDCKGVSCPLYQYMPYCASRKKRQVTDAERERLTERLKKITRPIKSTVQDAEIL